MSRKSDKEFWASRTQNRFRIWNLVTGERCEISANHYFEALAKLGWKKNETTILALGKKQLLSKPKWYVRNATQSRKDKENE
ncbi:hypothetical protein LCGC14_1116720 [marine sediment metagenome]|uniref:Uncharacterized protein n=1 Tax=marine sediment metagenome TaxID=412755 RepID=A0A0F9MT30_9ZZZZ